MREKFDRTIAAMKEAANEHGFALIVSGDANRLILTLIGKSAVPAPTLLDSGGRELSRSQMSLRELGHIELHFNRGLSRNGWGTLIEAMSEKLSKLLLELAAGDA